MQRDTPSPPPTDARRVQLERTVELLCRERPLLARLLDTVRDALFIVDARQRIIFWNAESERLTGFTADEVLGNHCLSGIRCGDCLYTCGLFELGEVRDVQVTL